MGPRPRNRARTHRFSALTFPNPASPRAVVDPTHVQTRQRPMSALSARVHIAPSESPARFRPRVPATLAHVGLAAPPTSKRYSSPLSPRSLVLRLARSAIRPACAVTRFFSPERVGESGEIGTEAREGAHAERALAPVPVRAAPPAVDRTRRASDPIGSRAPPRIERDAPRRGFFPRDDRYERSRGLLSDRVRALFPTSPLPRRARQAHCSQDHRRPRAAHRRAHQDGRRAGRSRRLRRRRPRAHLHHGRVERSRRAQGGDRQDAPHGTSSRTRSDARPSPSSTTACTATTPGSASPRRR